MILKQIQKGILSASSKYELCQNHSWYQLSRLVNSRSLHGSNIFNNMRCQKQKNQILCSPPFHSNLLDYIQTTVTIKKTSACSYKDLKSKYEKDVYVTIPLENKDDTQSLTMKIKVIDTHPDDIDQTRLTVVTVLGYKDDDISRFLLRSLYENGIRVIIPNFVGTDKIVLNPLEIPDVDYTHNGRLIRLDAILKTLEVKRIDMMLSNYAGVWTLLKAGATWDNIHTLVCLNPTPSKPYRFVHPFRPVKRQISSITYRFVRYFIRPIVEKLCKKKKPSSGFLFDLYWNIMSYSFEKIKNTAQLIKDKRTPMLIIYSEDVDDKTKTMSEMFLYKLLKVPTDSIVRVKREGIIFKTPKPDKDPFLAPTSSWFIRSIVFEDETRGRKTQKGEVEKMYGKQVMAHVQDFLRRARDLDWWPDSMTDGGLTEAEIRGNRKKSKFEGRIKD